MMSDIYKELIGYYIKAKDYHRPHLMEMAFAEDAVLEMEVNTSAINFPSKVLGRDNITATLVKKFHEQYDNVYTLCINDGVINMENGLQCQWLVGMTDVESGSFRIGYGHYLWRFATSGEGSACRVEHLTITIQNMVVLPAESASLVLPWFDSLSYPWAFLSDLSLEVPNVPILHEFLEVSSEQ
ncbi:MAG: hypothetical protein ACRBBR_10350 [Cellvibrionaceae bacterium]